MVVGIRVLSTPKAQMLESIYDMFLSNTKAGIYIKWLVKHMSYTIDFCVLETNLSLSFLTSSCL